MTNMDMITFLLGRLSSVFGPTPQFRAKPVGYFVEASIDRNQRIVSVDFLELYIAADKPSDTEALVHDFCKNIEDGSIQLHQTSDYWEYRFLRHSGFYGFFLHDSIDLKEYDMAWTDIKTLEGVMFFDGSPEFDRIKHHMDILSL